MSNIIDTTRPNSEGEMLWCIHYASSYYDNDARMPGTVPIDARFYVLAKNRDDAISKASQGISASRKRRGSKKEKEEIVASIVTIEDLLPARDSSGDGRLGWTSTNELSAVVLFNADDAKRFRLGVCLIPVE